MILLVDIGNARIKWARAGERGALEDTGQKSHRGRPDAAAAALQDAFKGNPPDRVMVSNVAGLRFAERIDAMSRDAWGVEPHRVRVEDGALGVRCGYREPNRLGVDRWIAVLAASRVGEPVCVVDAGTALTIDAVTADRRHLGGVIIPGRVLMARALDRDTSDIGSVGDGPGAHEDSLGTSTEEAVVQGAWLAMAGAVELARVSLEKRLGATPRLMVTGGDGASLTGWLSEPNEFRPHLVLEGLALLADKALTTPG